MTPSFDIVLLHGWAIGSGVWDDLIELIKFQLPDARVTALELPGYGKYQIEPVSADLAELAQACLKCAPEHAIWIGWSLGGMVAMQAALQQPNRVLGLQLINSTPRFVGCRDWPYGVTASTLASMKQDLIVDKRRALRAFMALQAGSDTRSRAAIRSKASRIQATESKTLIAGLDCLEKSDLRTCLSKLRASVPVYLVCGLFDRVIDHHSSVELANLLGAPLLRLKGGHAVFLTHPGEVADNLASLYTSITESSKSVVNHCA